MTGKRGFMAGVASGLALAFVFILVLIGANFMGLGNGLKVAILIKAKALETLQVSQLVDGAMKGMVEELEDPYSAYLDPEEYASLETNMKGTYGGLGLYVGIHEDTNRLTVMAPIKNTPAALAGIKAGDEIWKIDGKDVRETDVDTAVSMMKGDPGTKVNLSIKRANQNELIEMAIVREIIEIPSVEGSVIKEFPEMAYVNISMFNEHTGKELGQVITDLKKENQIKGLILDLRNNPGGSLTAAIDAAGYFVPAGKPVVWLVDKDTTEAYPSAGNLFNLPTVVLINQGSASASEILAGAIKDMEAGTILGETSFGKGIVQTVFPLEEGAALKITTAKYLTPLKNDIHEKGIVPDVEVVLPENADPGIIYSLDPEKDIQLKKAGEILEEKIKE